MRTKSSCQHSLKAPKPQGLPSRDSTCLYGRRGLYAKGTFFSHSRLGNSTREWKERFRYSLP